MRRHASTLMAIAVACLSAGPLHAQGRTPPTDTAALRGAPALHTLIAAGREASDLRIVLLRFEADSGALTRRYDIPLSPVLHARMRAFYTGWQSRLDELNATALNAAGRADLAALRSRIAARLDDVAAEERAFAEIAPLVPFARAIQQLQERRRERADVDPVLAAQTLSDAVKEVRRATAAIRDAAGGRGAAELRGITAAVAARAADFLTGAENAPQRPGAGGFGAPPVAPTLQATLDSWHSFYNGYDPLFSWWTRKPYEELVAALQTYSRAIRQEWRITTD
ncbi:MAG TPA: hypothetical protein VMN60_04345 [Longimicrobiales bacterium]|nr:hypothetical protein [Longimicrobiales bacterium]